jgi:mono/diheme cytochrome c family protein
MEDSHMKKMFAIFFVLGLAMLVLTACGAPASSGGTTRPTPPADYASKTNPVAGNADAIAKGKEQYTTLCQACHGASGQGDGPAGASLTPKPANLVNTAKDASDAYIYWRIAEGGAMDPFKSSMPAHKATMKEDQIWQVVSYLRSLK